MMTQKMKIVIGVCIAGFVLLLCAGSLFEVNRAGYFQVKQAAGTGSMSVRLRPGWYAQMFGEIFTYKNVATVGFGKSKGEGTADISAIPVIFNDGSKAQISGLVRIQLPKTVEGALQLKNDYAAGFDHFIVSGVVPIVQNAVKLSANLRSAQDAYTTLALFQQAVEDQLQNGIYVTKSDTRYIEKSVGAKEMQKVTVIVRDKAGNPKRLPNQLAKIGCVINQCVIDVPQFDEQVEKMIAKRKDEAMATELAKQAAIRAKQDTITALEMGKAKIAKAKAEKDVIRVAAVTEAQKAFEVEQYAAKRALETAKKVRAEGAAKAAANRALVAAGLTPRERAEFDLKIADAVSKNLSKTRFPGVVMSGNSGKSGGAENPLAAMGYNAMYDLSKKMMRDAGVKSKASKK